MDTPTTAPYRVAILGTGRPRNTEGWTGWGMAHAHARGYNASGQCRIVALCDIVPEKAELFNGEHADGQAAVYADYEKLLDEVRPDIVSVCTWPALHAPMVIACARAGVKAIHCEKPMAPTWGESRRMAQACAERGVQLTFNHQRRFLESFQTARTLVKDGAIGDLVRLEGACSNLLDWGTHWLNMFSFYNDDIAGEWVMGQVDARAPRFVYGVPMETQAVCQVRYRNGVTGLLLTGEQAGQIVGCANRLIGTEGMIEVHDKEPTVRLRGKGDAELRAVDLMTLEGGIHGDKAVTRTVADVVQSLREGRTPLVAADNALNTTEVIYATYESARRRGRIDLPLTADDHPLQAMLDAGVFPEAVKDAQATDAQGRSNHLA